MIQPQTFVFAGQYPVACAVAYVQKAVDDDFELAVVEAVGRSGPVVVRRTGAVVGGEYDHGFVVLDPRRRRKSRNPPSRGRVGSTCLRLRLIRGRRFRYPARGVETDVQQIGRRVFAQPVLGDGLAWRIPTAPCCLPACRAVFRSRWSASLCDGRPYPLSVSGSFPKG